MASRGRREGAESDLRGRGADGAADAVRQFDRDENQGETARELDGGTAARQQNTSGEISDQ